MKNLELFIMYKHIFFDLDHTLWDFETNSQETLAEIFEEFSLKTEGVPDFSNFHETYSIHNDRFWERFRKGYISREDLRWKRMWHTLLDFNISNTKLAIAISIRYLEILPTKKHLFPDSIEILDYLKAKNYPIHLITNGFEQTQRLKMEHSGITNYFGHVVTSESACCLKPGRAIFDFALQKAQCLPAEGLMIGDTLEVDIVGARNAGMDQAYYNPAKPANGQKPTYIINSLSELKEIL